MLKHRKWLKSVFLPIFCAMFLFAGCGPKIPEIPLLPDSPAKIEEGRRIVQEGEDMVDEGEDLIDEGEDLIKKGKKLRRRGKEKIEQGEQGLKSVEMLEEAELLRRKGESIKQP
ncbi:MAG: hypothetical protein B6245_09875 [Desulfobacteraceae bacterium 4572_88]|nr:MAG: hypothetical protein B6245_09875 [Desulfobacteraceae bacterium 4572_88]